MRRSALVGVLCGLLVGCGSGRARPGRALPPLAGVVRGPALVPVRVGAGARFRPLPGAISVVGARDCAPGLGTVAWGAHVELFARGRVVVMPSGIGVVGPVRFDGARVVEARCVRRVRSLEPTGLVAVGRGPGVPTLGTLFGVWGQPLGRGALAGFRGPVAAWVNGVRWRGEPGAIALRRHAAVVLEVGSPRVVPHPAYGFPPGY